MWGRWKGGTPLTNCPRLRTVFIKAKWAGLQGVVRCLEAMSPTITTLTLELVIHNQFELWELERMLSTAPTEAPGQPRSWARGLGHILQNMDVDSFTFKVEASKSESGSSEVLRAWMQSSLMERRWRPFSQGLNGPNWRNGAVWSHYDWSSTKVEDLAVIFRGKKIKV